MKEPRSYFEWELQFKPKIKAKSSNPITKSKKKRGKCNRLGIIDKEFVSFVKNWKKQNKI